MKKEEEKNEIQQCGDAKGGKNVVVKGGQYSKKAEVGIGKLIWIMG